MLIRYRVGDIVDIKANGAVQKGSVPLIPRIEPRKDIRSD
jgi:ribosomal protein L21E